MVSNSNILDENGNSSDWIEIYNGTEKTINLKVYGLSDKPKKPYKWIFPEQEIKPGEYTVVFTASRYKNGSQGALNANFGLSEHDKGVYLSSPNGNLVSSIGIERLPKDSALFNSNFTSSDLAVILFKITILAFFL